MISNTLKKWRRNWKFLLAATLVVTFLSHSTVLFGSTPWCVVAPCTVPPSIWMSALFWPFMGRVQVELTLEFRGFYGWLLLLLFFWNAFLWAWALLELKQVLARTFTRRQRTQQ